MMSRNDRDLLSAFVLALLIHVALGVYAVPILAATRVRALETGRRDDIVPQLQWGESSLELTLLVPPEAPEEPEEVEDEQPLLEPDSDIEVEPEPVPEEEPVLVPETVEDAGVLEAPSLDGDIAPRYPLGSRERGEEGVVTVRVVVDARGRAESLEILESSGFSALDKAALKALRRAEYTAGKRGDIPEPGEVSVTIQFTLDDR